MNYQKIYDQLMQRAKDRELEGYCERHHVVPRCLGGKNHLSNLVELTAEEHYVAHQLLVKIYPDHPGILWAALAMTGKGRGKARMNNKLYSWLRQRFVNNQKGKKRWSRAMRKRLGAHLRKLCAPGKKHPRYGKKHSQETKEKISRANRGRKHPDMKRNWSPEGRASISRAMKIRMRKHNPMKGQKHTEATRQKMREIWAERKLLKLEELH